MKPAWFLNLWFLCLGWVHAQPSQGAVRHAIESGLVVCWHLVLALPRVWRESLVKVIILSSAHSSTRHWNAAYERINLHTNEIIVESGAFIRLVEHLSATMFVQRPRDGETYGIGICFCASMKLVSHTVNEESILS